MADFTVHVQGFNVRKSEYQVKPSTTVRDLLDQVLKDSPGVASSLGHIKPIFRAKILVFHVPLSAYDIDEGDTIVLGRATTQLMRFADFEFSSNWNYDFTDKDDSGKKFTRGKYDYLRPIPYKRFGLHVKDRFDNGNNAWLREDAAAWPVAYFATGFDSKGDCLRTAGYVASTALAELPFDVPMAYFFSMDVKRVERFATSCVIDGKPCLVVVQARVNPEHIVELGDGIWAAKSADCFRPYGVLVKGDIQMTKSALLQAMNSLLPYVEILSETDYAARTKSGKESGAGDFSIPTCVPHLCIGGPLCTGKELEEVEGQEDEVVEVEWPTDVPHDLAKRVLDKNASDAIITKTANKYIVKGPRVDVHQAVSSLQAAMQSIGPAEWSSKGMKATLVPLKTDMTKFKHVSDRFHATASRAEYRIDAIEQIENRPLYTRFHKYRETVAIKCIPTTRPQWDRQRKVDRELFYTPVHKVVDPATVYKGDVGFRRNDVPTSTPYGQGVTFASNAAVACTTNPFPAQKPPNQYQVILATVVTGVPQVVPAKKEFKEPDLMTDSVAEGDRYDCVQGPNADGAEVFVLYTDYAAYPTYLITYTKL